MNVAQYWPSNGESINLYPDAVSAAIIAVHNGVTSHKTMIKTNIVYTIILLLIFLNAALILSKKPIFFHLFINSIYLNPKMIYHKLNKLLFATYYSLL
jgi:hypothetical protein